MKICLVPANDVMLSFVMEHFAFPGNIDFTADDQRISCIIHERLTCLSRAISHANDPAQQAQQVAGNPRRQRFSTETSLENAD